MKRIMPLLLVASLFLLAACQSDPTTVTADNHVGCQEGEIDENGDCVPAEERNVQLFGQDLEGKVETREVSDPLGYLARPTEPGDHPGVVMIHEWWGLNDNIKEMARILANEGYAVFAVDLYDGEVAETSSRAGQLAGSVRSNPEEAIQHMKDAAAYLREEQQVSRIASLGWCFGGQQSLQLSLNEELDATVIYYGNLVEGQERLAPVSGPVLGVFGEEDGSIPVSSVRDFESSLDSLGVENQIYIYPGVGHAFANPSGSNYAANETRDAWAKTVRFLNENLKEEG